MKEHQRFIPSKLSTAITLACATTAGAAMLGPQAAFAAGHTSSCLQDGSSITISGSEDQCIMAVGEDLTVTSAGSITATGSSSAGLQIPDHTSVGSIDNSGDIIGGTSVGAGINIGSQSVIDGDLTNSGTIESGGNTSTSPGIVHGIYFNNNAVLTGSLTNSDGGSITAADDGIYVDDGHIGGSVINDGDINAGETGIYFSNAAIGGSLINTGDITAVTEDGIHLDSTNIAGDLDNSGTITAGSSTSDNGIYVYESQIGGNLTNSNTIDSAGEGIFMEDAQVVGDLINTSNGQITAHGYGIQVSSSQIMGDLINNGTIDADYAGIDLNSYSQVLGDVINSGDITSGSSYDGLYISYSQIIGDVINTESGTIDAGETGIYLSQTHVRGNLTNNGTIEGGNDGIRLEEFTHIEGDLINTDLIDVSSTGISFSYSGVSGDLINSGTIEADSAGIYADDATLFWLGGDMINTETGVIDAGATGVFLSYTHIAGDFINAGLIEADADGVYSDYGGPQIGGDFINSGKIDAASDGIALDNAKIGGDFTNSGTILAGDSSDGIFLSSAKIGGDLTNSGTIEAGDGIYIDDYTQITGDLINTETGSIDAGSTGIYVYRSQIGGDLINAGTIDAGSDGIYLTLTNIGGNLLNSGSIDAGSTGISIYNATNVLGDVTNSGSIEAGTYGIYFYSSTIGGDMVNTGSIDAGSTGVYFETATLAGDFTNEGNITGGNNAHGIYMSSSSHIAGDLVNAESGVIEGGVDGIRVGSVSGGVYNYGTITAGTGWSIYVDASKTVGDGIINEGTITGGAMGAIFIHPTATNGLVDDGNLANGDESQIGIFVKGDEAEIIGNVSAVGALFNVSESGEGYFENNGNIAVGSFSISNDGSMRATGGSGIMVADGNLTNAGTFAVTAGSGPVALAGNYVQTGDGVFAVVVEEDGSYGQLAVMGDADLSDNNEIMAVSDVMTSATLEEGDVLDDVLTTGGNITTGGNGAPTVTVKNLLVDFSVAEAYDVATGQEISAFDGDGTDTAIDLLVTGVRSLEEVAVDGGADLDTSGVSDALIAISGTDYSSEMDEVFTAINTADTPEKMARAMTQITPTTMGTGVANVSMTAASGFTGVIMARMDDFTPGGGEEGLASGDVTFSDRSWWAKPYGSVGEQDEKDGIAGYEIDTHGIAFGIDGSVSPLWRVGVGASYTTADVDSTSQVAEQGVDIDTYQASLYGTRTIDKDTRVKLQAGIGWSDYDGKRVIDFDGTTRVANADYDGMIFAGKASLEKDNWLSDKSMVRGMLFGDYAYVDVDGYTEDGAGGFDMKVSSTDQDSLIVGVGGMFRYLPTQNGALSLRGSVGYDVLADDASVQARFASGDGPTFTTEGMDTEEFLFRGGVGYQFQASDKMTVDARYDTELRDGLDNHAFSVKFKYSY